MPSLWDDIAKTIREGVDTMVEKTEELTKIGRIKVDIINIKRNIEKNFTELGGRVYQLVSEGKSTQIASNKDVKELIECVKILEKELHDKNEELKTVKTKAGGDEEPSSKAPAKAQPKAKPKQKPAAKSSAKKSSATSKRKTTPKAKTSGSQSKNAKGD